MEDQVGNAIYYFVEILLRAKIPGKNNIQVLFFIPHYITVSQKTVIPILEMFLFYK